MNAYRGVDPVRRLPWYGPDMAPASSITARLMETSVHGQDIVDTLGVERAPSDRLRHIAHRVSVPCPTVSLVTHLPPPTQPIAIQLTAPDEGQWSWGPTDAVDRVTGEHRFLSRGDAAEAPRRYRLGRDRSDCAPVDRSRGAFAGPAGPGRPPQLPSAPTARMGTGARWRDTCYDNPNDQQSARSDDDAGHP